MNADFITQKYFRQEKDIIFHLGPGPKPGQLFLPLSTKQFWQKERWWYKIYCLLRRKWSPKNEQVVAAAREILSIEVFGTPDDYGDKLYNNIVWFYHQDWQTEHVTEADMEKVTALDSMTIITRISMANLYIPMLELKLATKVQYLCSLTHMMIVKVPVLSMHYFMELDFRFTVNSIRKAGHPCADELIAYLYELLTIQQKIALSLHEYLLLVNDIERNKGDASLTLSELKAIQIADLVITYLKASVEKTVLLLGYTFEIKNLDGKAKHSQKISALENKLPAKVRDLPYYNYIMGFVSTENLEHLNNYRSGLLHKRGIADLQPHRYMGQDKTTVPLKKVFVDLHDQQARNTAVLLATLALLTDDIAARDKPTINPLEMQRVFHNEIMSGVTDLISQMEEGLKQNEGAGSK